MLSFDIEPADGAEYWLTKFRLELTAATEPPTVVVPKVDGGGAPEQAGIAWHTSSRPPVRTRPVRAGSGSTLERMSAFSAVVESGSADRISAAAPDTVAEAIEPPLMYP